jgi:soluble lytic murein transglycosylase-like protein
VVQKILVFLLTPAALLAQASPDFEASVRASMAASLEKQRAAVQKQTATAQSVEAAPGFFTASWPATQQFTAAVTPVTPAAADCSAMPKPELDKIVNTAAEQEGISAELVQLVIGKESASKPCAVSPKGAQGLMQLMPSTAGQMGVKDPFDPKQNVEGGTRLLKQLLTKYKGDVALALGAYNAGSGRVDQAGGIPQIPETMNYVSDIMSHFKFQ